jgi:DNA-damage-inducible protein J
MTSAIVNVRTDPKLKADVNKILSDIGLDMTTAINLFFKQTVRLGDLPFSIGRGAGHSRTAVIPATSGFGSHKGKMWISDDFDQPLDDFAEYM